MFLLKVILTLWISLFIVSCKNINDRNQVKVADLPILPENPTGIQLAEYLALLSTDDQEKVIYRQFQKENIPEFLKSFQPIFIHQITPKYENALTIFVTPDYLALGTNDDYLYIPIRPGLAQRIADLWDSSLPTKKIVDDVHQAAPVKLHPYPLTPDESMTTFPVFHQHSNIIQKQRDSVISDYPQGTLTAGNKKDIVISNNFDSNTISHNVAIYGWHYPNGSPIQPLYTGHTKDWVDYSHGIRLISNTAILNGDTIRLQSVMKDPELCSLVSDEGLLKYLRYP